MHTLKLVVLDVAGAPQSFEVLKAAIAERMWRFPAFNRRLVSVPFDLHYPVWVPVAHPDLDYHIRAGRVPTPGDDAATDALVGRLAGWPLDRRRPLWQVWILEGRRDGRLGILVKLHHCVADGVAANALLGNLMSENGPAEGESARLMPPTRGELLREAVVDVARDVAALPSVVRSVSKAIRRRSRVLGELERGGAAAPPRPILDTPSTSFNRSITAARTVATTTLDLAGVLEAKRRHGCSVNDVFLTLVGGALSDVLAESGEHPRSSLTASVPVSSEPRPTGGAVSVEPVGARPRSTGNKVSNLFVSLHTEIADPVERLSAVHGSMDSAKRVHDALGADVMETLLGYTPPTMFRWVMRAYSRLGMADFHRAPTNVICSNVMGPREHLSVSRAELVEFYSAGPVLEGIGVNITAWSYADHMDVMVITCSRAMPEPQRLTSALHRQLDALLS